MLRSAVTFVALSLAAIAPIVVAGENDEQVMYREGPAILSAHCIKCHGPDKQENGLRLDHGAAILRGGDSGTAVVAGKSSDSLLVQAVMGASDSVSRMPLKAQPLAENKVATLRRWIDAGAKVPAGSATEAKKTSHWA